MTWISFKDIKKPEEGGFLLTCSLRLSQVCMRSWRIWEESNLKSKPKLTHWWDGEYDYDLALYQMLEIKSMTWVSFKVRKPKEGGYLITASKHRNTVSTESWSEWDNSNLKITPKITHWWDGAPIFDLAISEWPKPSTSEASPSDS